MRRVEAHSWGLGTLGDDDSHAFFVEVWFVKTDLVGNAHDAGHGAAAWVEAQRAEAASDDEADVASLDAVDFDALTLNGFHLGGR